MQIVSLQQRAESIPVTGSHELITATSDEVVDAGLKAQFQQKIVAALPRAQEEKCGS